MKKISKLLCVILCLAMVMSFAFAVSATDNSTAGFVASELGYENGVAVENIEGEVISFLFSDGGNPYGNCPKFYTTGNAIRFYGENTLTISVADGFEIVSVTVTTDSSKPMNADNTALTNANAEYSDDVTVLTPEVGTDDIVMTYTSSSGHWRVQSVSVAYTLTGSEDIPAPVGPVACQIPGTLTYTFETDDAASTGVMFQWTATADGELSVAKRGDGYMTEVQINGTYGEIGNVGFVVKTGDVVNIIVYGFCAGDISVPVEFDVDGGEQDAALGTVENPEVITELGAYEKTLESGEYFFQFTAPAGGELEITTIGNGTHNMEVVVNGNNSLVYSNWDNDGEFIRLTVAAGDVVSIKVYFDFPGNGTINFELAMDGAELPVLNPTVADGEYVISWNGLTFAALAEDKGYGYPYAGDVNNLVDTDYVTILNLGDGIFTMQDCYGRYIYMTGSYNSFNVSADLPDEGHLWILEETEGGLLLKNVLKEKYVAYSEQYSSWGCYADISATSVLTVAPVNDPVQPTGDAILAVLAVLAASGLGLTAVVSKKK